MVRVLRNWKDPALFVRPAGSFRLNGPGRRYMSAPNIEFRDEAFAALGFHYVEPEPMFANFLGEHFLDGAYTHPHTDFAPQGYVHVRANWMLEKPEYGGDPIIGGFILNVQPGDLWVCFASIEEHSSFAIKGGVRRVCSFGALVPTNEINKRNIN